MLNQQSFLKRRNILAKMTATKQQWPFYFVLKLLYCKDKRVLILLMLIRQICWTLANLRGTFGHFRLLHFSASVASVKCVCFLYPFTTIARFFVFAKWCTLYLSSFGGTFGIFRLQSSTTSACVYLHFHSSLLRPRSIL